jgi:hypothetical protein
MKKRRQFNFSCLLLIIGLAAGIWLGYNFADRKLGEQSPIPTETLYPTNKDQRSLLVIGVDQLNSSNPQLRGVWYVAYFPNKAEINLVPLYPAIYEPYRADNNDVAAAFQLNRSGDLSPKFLAALDTIYDLTLGVPVLFDDFALISLIELLGGVEINGRVIKDKSVVTDIPTALDNVDDALTGQATLLNALCHRAAHQKRLWQPSDLRAIIPNHLRTNFDIDQALADWASLNAIGPEIKCAISIPGQHTPP